MKIYFGWPYHGVNNKIDNEQFVEESQFAKAFNPKNVPYYKERQTYSKIRAKF